jgi:(1->4)-alpha-D-glucan 1-alpha-D-glucosylmutase
MKHKDTLAQLAALYGIASEYDDAQGNHHLTETATQRALLIAMGVELNGDLSVMLAEHEARPWRSLLPPVMVVRAADNGVAVPVSFPSMRGGNAYRWLLMREDGSR